jgi:hypothetical protein
MGRDRVRGIIMKRPDNDPNKKVTVEVTPCIAEDRIITVEVVPCKQEDRIITVMFEE